MPMLRRLCLFLLVLLGWVSVGKAQIVKEFRTAERAGFNLVSLDFSTYKSITEVKRNRSSDPVYIHGHLGESNILPVFTHEISENALYTTLIHKNAGSSNIGRSITSKIFSGSNTDFDHSWNVGLNTNYLYQLDFNLGMGKADFDLAKLTVNQLKVKSASADVNVYYSSKSPNTVLMDTLLVTLNMGTVKISDANYSNAEKMIFEVNYGTIDLSFSEGMTHSAQVLAAVGAGSLYLRLPGDSYPVKLKMKTSPMCKTSLPKYLRTVGKGVYVTKGYSASDPNLLELTIDVGVGSLTIE